MKYFLIILVFLICSCSGKLEEKKRYYDTGELKVLEYLDGDLKKHGEYKVFYKNGSIKIIAEYEKDVYKDTMFFYYKNGAIKSKKFKFKTVDSVYIYTKDGEFFSKGKLENGDLLGWVEKFDVKTKSKIAKVEIVKIDDDLIENQTISYSKKLESNYLDIISKDTLLQNKLYPFSVKLNTSIPVERVYFCWNHDLKEDFSNINDVKLDTTYALSGKEVKTEIGFRNKGNNDIKGFIEGGYFDIKEDKKDSSRAKMRYIKTRVYINKEFYVIESDKEKL